MNKVEIRPVHSINICLSAYEWPFLREARAEIEDYWRALKARIPQVFDGRVLLLHRYEWRDVAFHGLAFETSYSAFMTWKSLGFPETGVRNFFGMAALRSADGAFLLGEMGPHTANAGQSYFPAGTPEPCDVLDGHVDLAGSVLRECHEETGLAAHDMHDTGQWTAIAMGGQIAFMRDIRIGENADAGKARIESNLAREERPEFSKIHIIRQASDAQGLTMPAFMQPFLDYALG